jgi:quinol monooxygenase YgiN
MSECTEVYVYEIQPDRVEEFLTVKDQLISEARTLPGLIASATLRSNGQDNLFIDRMKWASADHATKGLELFQALPTSATFMSMMAGPPKVGGRFTVIAGS